MWKVFKQKSTKMKVTSKDGSPSKSLTLNRPRSLDTGDNNSLSLPRDCHFESRTFPPPPPNRTSSNTPSTPPPPPLRSPLASSSSTTNKSRPVSSPGAVTMSCVNSDDSCAINELLEGRMYLTVILPQGLAGNNGSNGPSKVVINVERRTPMMDILVNIATQYKFNASQFRINVEGYEFKASTPIGSLDVNQVSIVPKPSKTNYRHSLMSTSSSSNDINESIAGVGPANSHHHHHSQGSLYITNVPFKTTFRLQVNLPRNQLMVLRVAPESTIAQVKAKICEEKELDQSRYQLTAREERQLKLLDPVKSFADYGIHEVTLMSIKAIAQVQMEHSTSTINAASSGSGGDTNRHSAPVAGACHEDDGQIGRKKSGGPVVSSTSDVGKSSKPVKKRPAPLPPSKAQKQLEEVNGRGKIGQNGGPMMMVSPETRDQGQVKIHGLTVVADSSTGHLRQDSGSDSSGYHESVLSSESPGSSCLVNLENGSKEGFRKGEDKVVNKSPKMMMAARATSSGDREAGAAKRSTPKKRKAPLPPDWKDNCKNEIQESIECLSDVSVPLSSSSSSGSSSSKSTTSDYRTVTERNSSLSCLPYDGSSFTLVSASDDLDDMPAIKSSSREAAPPIPSPDSGTCCQAPLDGEEEKYCDEGSLTSASHGNVGYMADSAIEDIIVEETEEDERESYHLAKQNIDRDDKGSGRISSDQSESDENNESNNQVDSTIQVEEEIIFVEKVSKKSSAPEEKRDEKSSSLSLSPLKVSSFSERSESVVDSKMDQYQGNSAINSTIMPEESKVIDRDNNFSGKSDDPKEADESAASDINITETVVQSDSSFDKVSEISTDCSEEILPPSGEPVELCNGSANLEHGNEMSFEQARTSDNITTDSIQLTPSEAIFSNSSEKITTNETTMNLSDKVLDIKAESSVDQTENNFSETPSSSTTPEVIKLPENAKTSQEAAERNSLKESQFHLSTESSVDTVKSCRESKCAEELKEPEDEISANDIETTTAAKTTATLYLDEKEKTIETPQVEETAKPEQEVAEVSTKRVRDLCRPRVRLTNFKIGSYKPMDNYDIYEDAGAKESNAKSSSQAEMDRPKSLYMEAIKPVIVTASLKNSSLGNERSKISNFTSACYENTKNHSNIINNVKTNSTNTNNNQSSTSQKIAMFTPQPFKLNRMASWSGNDTKVFSSSYVKSSDAAAKAVADRETIAEKAEKIEKVLKLDRPGDRVGGHRCVSQIEINGDSTKVSIRNTLSTDKEGAYIDEESPIQVTTFLNSSDQGTIVNGKQTKEEIKQESKKVLTGLNQSLPTQSPSYNISMSTSSTSSQIKCRDSKSMAPKVPPPVMPYKSIPPPPPPPPPPMPCLSKQSANGIASKAKNFLTQRSISSNGTKEIPKQIVNSKSVPKFKKSISHQPDSRPTKDFHDALLNEIRACGGRGALKKVVVHR